MLTFKKALPAPLLFISAPVSAAPLALNLPSALADTKALLQANGQADVVVLGDSLSFRDGSYLPTFRNLLQSRYGDAGAGYQGFSLWSGAGFNNGWLREGINADLTPHLGLDGLWNRSSLGPYSTSGQFSQAYYRPQSQTVSLQYLGQPGGGTFEVRQGFDGPVVATLDTEGASEQVRTWNYTLPAGDTTYTVQPLGDGQVTILGQNNLSSAPGVRVHRAANGGWGIQNFLQRDATFDEQLALLGTDLVFVFLGQNDQAFTRSAYAQKMNELVDRVNAAMPSAEVVLVGTYNQGSPALAGLVEGMADVAAARGVGFMNLYSAAGDRAFWDANGYLDDGIHFSPAGGAYLGKFLFDAFTSGGASLSQRLLPGDVNLDERITADDYARIDAGFLTRRTGYENGDFDLDGVIDLDDYALIDASFLAHRLSSVAPASTSVPEPGALAWGLAGVACLSRRRRCPRPSRL